MPHVKQAGASSAETAPEESGTQAGPSIPPPSPVNVLYCGGKRRNLRDHPPDLLQHDSSNISFYQRIMNYMNLVTLRVLALAFRSLSTAFRP